jgi:tetratricopeptide (TPR) repeat protein
MLNYILPPIIIVISVSILIMFLFRKAAEIPEHELAKNDLQTGKNKNFSVAMSAAGQFGLKILEKMMRRAKLMLLKFHNITNEWSQSIGERRKKQIKHHQEMLERQLHEKENIEHASSAPMRQYEQNNMQTEREVRPMLGEKITRPEPRVQIKEKNKLEDALIKRIAINPRDIEAYERLGDYYLESNNPADSLECFKQVLRLSPSHQKARLRIKRLEKMGR